MGFDMAVKLDLSDSGCQDGNANRFIQIQSYRYHTYEAERLEIQLFTPVACFM